MQFGLEKKFEFATNVYGVRADDPYLFLAMDTGGFRIYKFIDGVLSLDDAVATGGMNYDNIRRAGYFFALDFTNLLGYRFNNGLVSYISNVGAAAGQRLYDDGTYLHVSRLANGVSAYTFNGRTFTNTANQAIPVAGATYEVDSDGTYFYIAQNTDGIYAYTFNGAAYTPVGNRDDGGAAQGVVVDRTRGYIFLANSNDGVRAYSFNGTTFTMLGRWTCPVFTVVTFIDYDAPYIYACVRDQFTGDNGRIYILTFDGTTFTQQYTYGDANGMFGVGVINENSFLSHGAEGMYQFKGTPNFGGGFSANVQNGSAPLSVNFTDETTIY